ncbi:MAG: divergent polysaccharide deacetylase family protein [Parvibaculum sp.]|nr:divergent polysaccharide deacetylase family protein [Parvibaculum sp.]
MPIRMLNDKGNKRRAPSILVLAASFIALTYGGVLLYLAFVDGRFSGKPVVAISIAPEVVAETEKPAETEAEKLLRESQTEIPASDAADVAAREDAGNADSDTPGATPIPADAPGLSPEELTLLEAAKSIKDSSKGDDADDAHNDGVKIVGAETVSSGGNKSSAPPAPVATPLAAVPDAGLIASSNQGPLPVISKDGRKAWKVYARPLSEDIGKGPRVALVVSGLGISDSATEHAIKTLPPEVTLSFAPYGNNLQNWIRRARDAGHEVLLELPMEPFGFPQNDPGPYTLLTSLSAADNVARLEWLLSRFTGYAGVMNYQGARFTSTPSALSPVLSAIKSRGLMYIDNGASNRSLAPKISGEIGLPMAAGTRNIDPVQSAAVIDENFAALESTAKKDSVAIGVASGFPVTVDAVAEWAQTLKDKGLVLVPVSSAAR